MTGTDQKFLSIDYTSKKYFSSRFAQTGASRLNRIIIVMSCAIPSLCNPYEIYLGCLTHAYYCCTALKQRVPEFFLSCLFCMQLNFNIWVENIFVRPRGSLSQAFLEFHSANHVTWDVSNRVEHDVMCNGSFFVAQLLA